MIAVGEFGERVIFPSTATAALILVVTQHTVLRAMARHTRFRGALWMACTPREYRQHRIQEDESSSSSSSAVEFLKKLAEGH